MTFRETNSSQICRFFRYNHPQSNQQSKIRNEVIPNRITFSDYFTPTPIYHRKKKKFPLFAACKTPKKTAQQASIFTNRGIVTTSTLEEVRRCPTKREVKVQKKNQSSLSLFNKLILTPYNFTRQRSQQHNHASSYSLTQKNMRLYTPNKSQNQEKRYNRKVQYSRTHTQWTRRQKPQNNKEERQPFVGWQTFSLEDEI